MAVTGVTGNTQISYAGSEQPTGLGGQVTPLSIANTANSRLGNGTGVDQVDRWYSTTLTFTASTPQVLDLTNLTSPTGSTTSFARVKRIIVTVNSTTDGQTLKLGYSTTTANAWTSLVSNPGQITLHASTVSGNSSVFVVVAPNATGYVVSSSNKLLNLDPGSNAFTATVDILGASA